MYNVLFLRRVIELTESLKHDHLIKLKLGTVSFYKMMRYLELSEGDLNSLKCRPYHYLCLFYSAIRADEEREYLIGKYL